LIFSVAMGAFQSGWSSGTTLLRQPTLGVDSTKPQVFTVDFDHIADPPHWGLPTSSLGRLRFSFEK
jgi:hypothetical protein